jgi:hypothetical protein
MLGDVSKQINSLGSQAEALGQLEAYTDALENIVRRLTQDPTRFGDYHYALLDGDIRLYVGAINPVAVRYFVHEKSKDVYIRELLLLGTATGE